MFEPKIHWHYSGKLRTLLEDAASRAFIAPLIEVLKSPRKIVLCAPVALTEILAEAMKRAFQSAGLIVSAMRVADGHVEYGISTSYDPQKAVHRLWICFGSGEIEEKLRPRRFIGQLLRRSAQRIEEGAILVFPARNDGWPMKDIDAAPEAGRIISNVRRCGVDPIVLPGPGLPLGEMLRLIETAPSQILDGSHESEKRIERGIQNCAESSPAGFLIESLWRALKSGYGPEYFSYREFKERLDKLDPMIASAQPWASLFSLWAEILRGFESDREYSQRWFKEVRSKAGDFLSLEVVHSILLYEHSIYAMHCERDRGCISYLVAYYGSYWLLRTMAFAELGSILGGSSGGMAWDLGDHA